MRGSDQRLEKLLEPTITALGYEFVGCQLMPQGRKCLLRVYIDSEQGINVDDCAKVSYQVSAILEVEDPIAQAYTLEVSSPGLDRPFFKPAQFTPFVGQKVQVRTHTPREGQRNFSGAIIAVTTQQLELDIEGQVIALPFDDIDKANLIWEQ